jgi:hypothetical protein
MMYLLRSNFARRLFTFVIAVLSFGLVQAQDADAEAEALAKAAQNPIASLISLPLQNNTDFGIGPDDKTKNTLNIQPVWPFALSDNWNLITRTIVPVISQPGLSPGQDRITGLGDSTFTAFFSPKNSGKWTWGVGPVILLPTGSDDRLSSDKWGAGISAVVLTMPGNWVIGSLFSNVKSVGGGSGTDVNLFTWQYFINYNFDGGWYATTAPIMTANWEADSSNRWTVPIGGGFGRVMKFGKQPVNMSAQVYKNIETPDFGSDWQLRLQVQFLFPK